MIKDFFVIKLKVSFASQLRNWIFTFRRKLSQFLLIKKGNFESIIKVHLCFHVFPGSIHPKIILLNLHQLVDVWSIKVLFSYKFTI